MEAYTMQLITIHLIQNAVFDAMRLRDRDVGLTRGLPYRTYDIIDTKTLNNPQLQQNRAHHSK